MLNPGVFRGQVVFASWGLDKEVRADPAERHDDAWPVRSHVRASGGGGSAASPGRSSHATTQPRQPAANAGFGTKKQKMIT